MALRPIAAQAGIGSADVAIVDFEMSGAHRVTSDDLDLTEGGDVGNQHSAEAFDARVVEDCALRNRGAQRDARHLVVGGEHQSIVAGGEGDGGIPPVAPKRLAGREPDRGYVDEPATDHDLAYI